MLVREELAVQGTEGAESVGGEEHAVGQVKGHHGLRPVDHGRVHEGHGVGAEAPGVAFLHFGDLLGLDGEAELAEDDDRLRGGDDLHFRPAEQDLLDGSGVIGFHVVDDHVVQGAAPEHGLDVFNELASHGPVRGIEENGLLVQQHVGVVGDAVVKGMDIFEQGQAVIIRADPVEVVCHFAVVIHI